jgi:hypothetical protein
VEEFVVKKRLRSHRLHNREAQYTEHQLQSTYQNCSSALSTPFLVSNGTAFYKRVDDHPDVTPLWDQNRIALERLNRCAVAAGDCFYDLQDKNIHLNARGHVVIIDANIEQSSWDGCDVDDTKPLSRLFGSVPALYQLRTDFPTRFYIPP